jgi:hypothetical protein
MSSTRRYLRVPMIYTLSSKRQDCRRSVAPRPTSARRWHVSSKPIFRPKTTQPWPTSGSPQLMWRRGARHPSQQHLRRAGTRAADLVGLRKASSPQSMRRSTNPERTPHEASIYAPTSTRTGVVVTLAGISTSATASVKRESSNVASTTIESTAPGRRPSDHGARRTRPPRRREPAACLVRGRLRPS